MKRFFKGFALLLLVCALNIVTTFVLLSDIRAGSAGPSATCVPGDVNGDGVVDVSDPILLLGYIFEGTPMPAACAQGQLDPSQLGLLTELFQHVSIEQLDDGQGGTSKTVRLTGVNLQVVNGLGATNGNPTNPSIDSPVDATNGLGNLIVGYNEFLNGGSNDRTGSHNIISGSFCDHSGYGSILSGYDCNSLSDYGLVVGGRNNLASGDGACVVGGRSNEASGEYSIVCGGEQNVAGGGSFAQTAVFGGNVNHAFGVLSTVVGGIENEALGVRSLAVGGRNNEARGWASTTVGGRRNVAHDAAGFGFWSDNTVVGGVENEALGVGSTVGGGHLRTANGQFDWVAGSLFEDD